MFHDFYLRGKELCEQDGVAPHLLMTKYSARLELGYDLSGSVVANLDSTEQFEATLPLGRVRTSGVFSYLFCEYVEPGDDGDVKPAIPAKYRDAYIKKHQELVPESDELFHEWLSGGCVVRYNGQIKGGRFDLLISGERAVEKYDDIVQEDVAKDVATTSGSGLWGYGALVDNASKVSGGNSLVSYNSSMYENNRPKCNLTIEENAYISRGWNEMYSKSVRLYKDSVEHRVGGLHIVPQDAVDAPYSDNADEIISKYVNAEVAIRSELKNSILLFFGVVKGRFEHELVVREDASKIFENIARFRSECGEFTSRLKHIIVKHYPAPEGQNGKVEWLNKTPTLYQSIWLGLPISDSDIAPVANGLGGYKHFKNPFAFVQTFSGALGLAKCYLTRKGISMDNYMYIAGQIMGLLHRQQSAIHFTYKVGGENVIWDLVKNLERPDQMLGTAMMKMVPYQDSKYESGPNKKVFELLQRLEDKNPKDIHPMDRNMCFFLGFSSTYNTAKVEE